MKRFAFTRLESERVILRRLTEADLKPFLAYLNDPLVARFQSWESYTEQQARDVIEKQRDLEPGQPGQWFVFAVELKETHSLVGHVALSVKEHHPQQAEMALPFPVNTRVKV
jgi:RimJ/RimL family protein N-acetyltransferase